MQTFLDVAPHLENVPPAATVHGYNTIHLNQYLCWIELLGSSYSTKGWEAPGVKEECEVNVWG